MVGVFLWTSTSFTKWIFISRCCVEGTMIAFDSLQVMRIVEALCVDEEWWSCYYIHGLGILISHWLGFYFRLMKKKKKVKKIPTSMLEIYCQILCPINQACKK